MPETIESTTTITTCVHSAAVDIDTILSERDGAFVVAGVALSNVRCKHCGQKFPLRSFSSPKAVPKLIVLTAEAGAGAVAPPPADAKKKPDPSLARSKINRDGLKAGTPAPEFRLPLLDGGAEVALADYGGRSLLLVFIGSSCGYCDQIAPDLQRLSDAGFPVLAIGQKSEAAMREKVAKLGLTLPVVMQREWEISKLYARFELPVAYLIGPDGVIERDVLVGEPPIRSVVGELIERAEAKMPAAV